MSLKDFEGIKISDYKQIIHMLLTKLQELIVKREGVKRGKDNQFATLDPKKTTAMHPTMVMKLGGEFWADVVHPRMSAVRWDIFEENFSVFLLETL